MGICNNVRGTRMLDRFSGIGVREEVFVDL